MNFDDFSYTENDRRYLNPQVSLDEQNAFIDNLRNMQSTNTAQITQDTRNLGTQVPSNLGGLTGGTSYFTSRYQTPQTNSMVSDLRATAQASALSTLMSNELAKAQKRYNDAYRAAKKRAAAKSNSGGTSLSDLLDAFGVTEKYDGSSDEKETGEADMNDENTQAIDRQNKEARLRILKNQLNQMKQKGHGPTSDLQWYEKINPIAYIGAANIWAGQYNRLNDEISKLESELNNGQ